jgi:REP element-mobilizing transposase RayT
MPFIKVYIHIIWTTKNRELSITKELKPILLDHIKKNSLDKGIFIDRMNCVGNHIHILVSLGVEQTISKTVMLLKGESSFWINKEKLTKTNFEWQDEYAVFSVKGNDLENVRNYINMQEEHHKKKTFEKEYEEFFNEYNNLG